MFKAKKQTPVANQSLVFSLSSLLQRLGKEVDSKKLQAHLSDLEPGENAWDMISLYDPQVQVIEHGDYGTWPTSNNSIIKFQYQPTDQPYIEDAEGNKFANVLDHYCIVADAGDHQIIDSSNGTIKNGNIYGQPVEWVTCELATRDEDTGELPTPPKVGSNYTVLKGGENAWELARKLNIGMSGKEIIEHNELDSADIPEGTVLHLPVKLPAAEPERRVVYEVLDQPLPMHVVKESVKKFAFGNAKTIADIKPSGPSYRNGANVSIHAIAHVPVGDNETAAFYMEASAVGDYKDSGSMAFTIGFNHSHLEEGHVEKVKVEPKPEISAKLQEAELRKEMIESVNLEDNPPSQRMDSDSLPKPEDEPVNHNLWKTTYRPLNEERTPVTYLFNNDMIVHDLDGRRRSVAVFRLKGVRVAGTFEKDGVVYARPQDAMDNFTWYGIPMDQLTSEDELFSTEIPLADRANGRYGRLTTTERYVTVPLSRTIARSVLVKNWVEKLTKKL